MTALLPGLAGLGLLLVAAGAQAQVQADPPAATPPMVTPDPVTLPRAAMPPRPRPRRGAQAEAPAQPPAAARGEPAPVPNNDLEAPSRMAAQRASPQINPALIDPAAPQTGTTRDAASLQTREERLLRQPAAGARLRLPFGY